MRPAHHRQTANPTRLILVIFAFAALVQSCTKSGSEESSAPYLGLWAEDVPMMLASDEYKEYQAKHPKLAEELPKILVSSGLLFTDDKVAFKNGGSDRDEIAQFKDISEAEGGYIMTVVDSKGRELKSQLKIEGDVLTWGQHGGKKLQRFRRCDDACAKKLSAGEKTLFDPKD